MYSLPVRSDLRTNGNGRRLLARTETCAVRVASKVGVGGISDGVVGVPLALDAALANRGVVRLESVGNG